MWHFEKQSPNQRARNPITDEFFADEATISDVDSLVRESIQNSLDAGVNNAVSVKFRISSLSASESQKWFGTLTEHVNASLGEQAAQAISNDCKYLLIEDFNTTGLTGDPEMPIHLNTRHQVAKAELSYFHFVHAEGESSKDGKRGTWGVGKIVFHKLSKLKTFLFLSDRGNQGNYSTVALGQSILKMHSIGEDMYIPDGWLSGQNETGLHIPLEASKAEEMRSDFDLQRNAGEPGLSVIVPFISPSMSARALAKSVIAQYYVPILSGELSVELEDDDCVLVLEKDTLRNVLREFTVDPEFAKTISHLEPLIELVEGHISGTLQKYEVSLPSSASKASDLKIDESLAQSVANDLRSGRSVSLKIGITVPIAASAISEEDSFYVLISNSESRARVSYSREGVQVPQANAVNLSQHVAIVKVEQGPLATLLASAEGPAHIDWSAGARKFKEKYAGVSKAGTVISIVRQAPVQIEKSIQLLEGPADTSLFTDIFPSPGGAARRRSGLGYSQGNGRGESVTPPQSSQSTFEVLEKLGGFKVVMAPSAKKGKAFSKQVKIKVAYKLSRGNSFAKWTIDDFDLRTMTSTSVLAKALSSSGNTSVWQLDGEEFEVSITGFDTTTRDIEISIEEVNQ